MSTAFPRTLELVRSLGYSTIPLDVSELHKAESGLTCMSLMFDARPRDAFAALEREIPRQVG